MKTLLMVLAVMVCGPAFAADTILLNNGDYVTAPKGFKVVFVPKSTGTILVQVKGVEVVEPWSLQVNAPKDPDAGCTPQDDLGVGGEPCPE